MRAAFAAINYKQFRQRELNSLGKGLDLLLQRAIFQRRELVKHWLDHGGINRDHQNLEAKPANKQLNTHSINTHECPQVQEKVGACVFNQIDKGRDQRGPKERAEQNRLEHV